MKKAQMAIVAAVLGIAIQAHGNLVLNGGFAPAGTFSPPNGLYYLVGPGDSTTIPGWTVQNQTIAWESATTLVPGIVQGNPAPYWLDVSGVHDAIPYGGVVGTTASTIAGDWYTLSFQAGKGLGQSPKPVVFQATAGSQSSLFTDYQGDPGGVSTVWETFTLQFQATGTSTAITLQATDANSGNAFVGLANVNVSAVPEPATIISGVLMLLPFGASTLRILRRRQVA